VIGDFVSNDLRDEIAREEARLAALKAEAQRIETRLASLRTAEHPPSRQRVLPILAPPAPRPSSTAEKIALFRELFRGRSDLFPKRWENNKTGKSGYALACSNEWELGVCAKPKVKCGECPNQAFLPVSDAQILRHLQGRHVMGVYPMLQDETCWFLAADFDKGSWQEDIAAFAETCRAIDIPVEIERSRSGKGGHAWFFFSAPVAAATARRLGTFLLTETMSRRHELRLDSYDRLFPNQDTMPRGGFGNLIALPFQYRSVVAGNTVFLDRNFDPFSDQWAHLAAVPRIDPSRVQAIADDAVRNGRVIGVRASATGDAADSAPWTRRPSGRTQRARIAEPLPAEVRVVFGQQLFVQKSGVPPALLNQIKRIAAFQNPEFYRRQAMRLSTGNTPRVIGCAHDEPEHVAIPRGCLDDLVSLLGEHDVALRLDDQRVQGSPVDWTFRGSLDPDQDAAARAMLEHDTGVLSAPPGVGKTVIGAWLISQRARNTLVLVHRQVLVEQWVAQLALFLGIDAHEIGVIGGGRRKRTGRLDVAMMQSLAKRGVVDDAVAEYGHVIVDECHHLPAVTFERVLAESKAKFVTGLTATPYRKDGHQPIIHMQCGLMRHAIDARARTAQRPFEHTYFCRETGFRLADTADSSIQALYAALAADESRNGLILDDVIAAVNDGRSPLVLTERVDHLEFLAANLRSFARHLIVLHGGMSARARREAIARLGEIPETDERLVIATGRFVGEGFDDPRLDTLFLAMPVAWKGTIVQYTGRLHRHHSAKRNVRVYDYVDGDVPVLARMFDKRRRSYEALGYVEAEMPVEMRPFPRATSREYDDTYVDDAGIA
jgi:superfamily II DNA or RNA helicase